MKKAAFLAASVVLFFAFKTVDTSTWTVDKMHGRLGFSITHLGVNDIQGNFKSFDCTVKTAKEDFSDAQVELSADVNTINTDIEKRDNHLKSPDFFDAAKFPNLNFKSSSVKLEGTNKYKITGELTMHGVTKPVTLEGVRKVGTNPYSKKEVVGFKITGTIKRSDFGIGASMPAPMLSDEVQLDANMEFGKN